MRNEGAARARKTSGTQVSRSTRVLPRWLALPMLLGSCVFSFSFTQQAPSSPKADSQEPSAQERAQAEVRVIDYIRGHLEPGKPLEVTELHNKVFTQPAERQALDKLYRAFFRIPLFISQYQERFGRPPTLKTIGEQFDLRAPGAADVLLRVMEADPRVPRFLTRDPRTGEITKVDVAAVRADPQFGQALEHQLGGWEGKQAPPFTLPGLKGGSLDSAGTAGKTILLYVWFTGCPPCIQESPVLVELNREFSSKGLAIIGANADRVLGLSYTDAVHEHYLAEHKIDFPVGHWTGEANTAYGAISIFPTLFLIDSKGIVRRHWVGFVSSQELSEAVGKLLATK